MWDGINRRKFPRANYNCTITIKSLGDTPKIISAKTENIGMGGICVILKIDIELFKNVELELLLEDGGPAIRCSGIIVWVVKRSSARDKSVINYDTGIEFKYINDAERRRVGAVVNRILDSA